MRLSVETHVLHKRYGDEIAIQMLKKAGFDSIDYSFYWLEEADECLGEHYREYAQKIRTLLEQNCMTCNQAHAPFTMSYSNQFDESDPEYSRLVRSIESAAIMGADNIVVHSLKTPPAVDNFAYNLAYYKSLQPYCEKFGICIAIENLFAHDHKCRCIRGRLHTPALLHEMIAMLESPFFVVCIDVGHAALTGYEPQDIIRQFDNKTLRSLHIHDNDYLDDRHTLPYAGSLHWHEIMQALKDIDYQGDFTFEIFGYLGKIDDDFIEEALAFSAKAGRHLLRKL